MAAAHELLELDITDVAHGGIFVARHEGRVVFVTDALPGERVLARVTDAGKRSFWRADTVEVVQASPERRPHVWASADLGVDPEDRPGGAEFGHIELAHQRNLKSRVLADALARFGGYSQQVGVQPIPGDEHGLRWRTRVQLHVDADGRIGPYAARSHRVITVPDLPLATAELEARARTLVPQGADRIDLVQAGGGTVRVLAGNDRARRETITEHVGDRSFQLDAGGFWQVHPHAATTLSEVVSRFLTGRIDEQAQHLDLYGGVGLFAAALATLGASRVTSVEGDARATEHAGENLAAWVGARAQTARVDRYLGTLLGSASAAERERYRNGVVVLDPPRSGAGGAVVRDLAQLGPASIVYVACDPVALARDVRTFAEHGYLVRQLESFDLFPNTHHFETVALLEPEQSRAQD